jgi:hypothetical protein
MPGQSTWERSHLILLLRGTRLEMRRRRVQTRLLLLLLEQQVLLLQQLVRRQIQRARLLERILRLLLLDKLLRVAPSALTLKVLAVTESAAAALSRERRIGRVLGLGRHAASGTGVHLALHSEKRHE